MNYIELIRQARELCEKATPGPWYNFGDWMIHTEPDIEHNGIHNEKTIGTVRANNAAFIAASRALVPQLCDALEAAKKENDTLRQYAEFIKANAVKISLPESEYIDVLTARAEKAEAENRWIPVGERLPENGIDVLLYWSNDAQNEKYVDMERYHIDHWETLDRPWIRAIAWMPLPEPPKGECT